MSNIQAAARAFVAKAEKGSYTDEDVKQLIEAVKQCDADPDGKKATYRAEATRQFQCDGDLEFEDDTAVVSLSDDEGAYVQCWKYIYADESNN